LWWLSLGEKLDQTHRDFITNNNSPLLWVNPQSGNSVLAKRWK